MTEVTSFSFLPEEIICHIFSFLEPQTLLCAAQVCTIWNKHANSNLLWKSLYDHYYIDLYHVPSLLKEWKSHFLRVSRIHRNWRLGNGLITPLNTSLQFVRHIFLRNSNLVFSSGDSFSVWDLVNKKRQCRVSVACPWIKALHVTEELYSKPSNPMFIVCAAGPQWQQLRIYNWEGELLGSLQTLTPIDNVRVLGSHQALLASNALEVWDLEHSARELHWRPQQLRGIVNALDIHHATGLIACTHKGKRVRFWDRRSEYRFQDILATGHSHLIHVLTFTKHIAPAASTTDWWLLTASKDTTARLWDLRMLGPKATPLAVLRDHEAPIRAVWMDRVKIVTGSKDGVVIVWDRMRPQTTLTTPHLAMCATVPFLWDCEPVYTLDVRDHLLVTGHSNAIYLYDFNLQASQSPTSRQQRQCQAPSLQPSGLWQSATDKFCVFS
jgi:WD40 repeat protein